MTLKTPQRRCPLWVLSLLLLATVSACGSDATGTLDSSDASMPPGQPVAGSAPVCDRDEDCPTGSGCSLSTGRCAPLATVDRVFSVEVLPDPASGLLGEQFPLVPVSPAASLNLSVSPPAQVTGRVTRAPAGASAWTGNGPEGSGPGGSTVAGRLVAVASGRIPGTQFWAEALVRSGDSKDASLGTYSLALLPGLSYRVTFLPERTEEVALPSHSFDLVVSGDTSLDIVLPPENAYLQIQGLVRAGLAPATPLRNAVVSCVVNGTQVGSTSTTGPDGMFSLIVPPGTGSLDIRVVPGPGRDPFPERLFRWEEGPARLADDYAAGGNLLVLDLGDLPPVRRVSLQVLGGSADGPAVTGARVRALGFAGEGLVSQSSVTSGQGVASLDLPEGRYRIAIFSPSGSPFASAYRDLDLTTDGGVAFLVVLPPRPVLRGQVVRATGQTPLPGSVLTLWTREDPSEAPTPREDTVTVTADGSGLFEVPLDPGLWAAMLVPPSDSGLPRLSWPGLDLSQSRQMRFEVPEGTLLRGQARRADRGTPLAGVTVRVMLPITQGESNGTWSLAETSFAVSLTTVAEVQTREDGTWDAIVPVVGTGERGGNPPPESEGGSDGSAGLDTFGAPLPESF